MRRRLLTCLSVASLILCVGTVGLWVRSYHHHDRLGLSTSQARYTVHSLNGRVELTRPPDAGPQTALAWQMASRIANDDVEWTIIASPTRSGSVEGWAYIPRYKYRPESGTSQMRGTFHFTTGLPSAARPLLKALEDPDRAAAAHAYLRYLIQGVVHHPATTYGDSITVYYDEALPVRFHKSDLKPGAVRLTLTGPAKADPIAWKNLRDLWHDRLDVKVFSVHYPWLISATALLPAVWLLRALRRRRVPGCCPICGYDLRATPERCPECGSPIPQKTGTTP